MKDDLSRYVDYVRRGGRVRILVRGVPAAELVPMAVAEGSDDDAELGELERRGIVRRGTGKFPREVLRPGPRWGGKPLSEIILADRKSGW